MGCERNHTHLSATVPVAGDLLDKAWYPDFLRIRYVSPRHHVATEEMDRELILDEKEANDSSLAAAFFKMNNEEEKEETWNRLNGLTTFALMGFGFSTVKNGRWDLQHGKKRHGTATILS